MNPHICPEQPGWSPDSGKNEDSVTHLRRLKGELAEPAPADAAAMVEARTAADAATSEAEERRRSPRFRCSGSAEIRAGDSDVRMWGTLCDVSLHGCYVEMTNTFPVDTRVALVLKSCGIRIQAPGRVRATYPALGMGIRFTEIEPGQQLQVERLLALLAGQGAASVGRLPQESHVTDADLVKETLRSADRGVFLAEIMTFFRENQVLSRDEFYEIAKRVRRS